MWIKWVCSLFALLVLVQLAVEMGPKEAPSPGVPVFHPGMSCPAWESDAYGTLKANRALLALRDLHVEWVALVVTWYQDRVDSLAIYRDPRYTPDDDGLVRAIQLLHRLGFKVMLKPTVDVQDGSWRGDIAFESEEQWNLWFSSYRHFLNHYARLAADQEVEELCVGVELASTLDRERNWREVIEGVRQRFPGPLVYAANWDSFWEVPFWDALDYVGIDAYFELAVDEDPTVEELMAAWAPWVAELEALYEIVQKPILFTEAGCRSISRASARPWDWATPGEVDLEEQARYYEATLRTFWDKPWFYGFYWWAWSPQWGSGGTYDTGYTPRGKPAADVLARWYARPSPRNASR